MNVKISRVIRISTILFLILAVSCKSNSGQKKLAFRNYPDLKIGFTTQNFQKAMPLSIENVTEIIEYASDEGFQFIELRDDLARLSAEGCRELAEIAKRKNVEVIYEIQKNPLDSGFVRVYNKAIENASFFKNPGILRVMISKSEFVPDPTKKGWNIVELNRLTNIVDSCASVANSRNLKLIVENSDEAFFGRDSLYFGLSDFFANTTLAGFQFDISNPFRKSSRERADPLKVLEFMSTLGTRWVASHIKTIKVTGGEMLPVLTDNPLPVEEVISLMGDKGVAYVAIELAAVDLKEDCLNNHRASLQFFRDKGLLK